MSSIEEERGTGGGEMFGRKLTAQQKEGLIEKDLELLSNKHGVHKTNREVINGSSVLV